MVYSLGNVVEGFKFWSDITEEWSFRGLLLPLYSRNKRRATGYWSNPSQKYGLRYS